MKASITKVALALAASLAAGIGHANISIPSDGSDGALNVSGAVTLDLSQAVTGTWSDSNTANAGKGIYDPSKWAVVYKFTSVNIASGAVLSFKNHPSKAPVVFLVSGDVNIPGTGEILLTGKDGVGGVGSDATTEPGPGGFRGGASGSTYTPAGPGFGPGASNAFPSYGVLGTSPSGPVYGNAQILPLIGGSGGGGTVGGGSGGAGGGAILIAAGGTITVNGYIIANGGYYAGKAGSGGAIRLVADTIVTTRSSGVQALAGYTGAGVGRIRMEANNFNVVATSPAPSVAPPAAVPVIFPPNQPGVAIITIDGQPVAADPLGDFAPTNGSLINIAKTTATTVRMTATNVPSTWTVTLRAAPKNGGEVLATATKVSGDDTSSVWTADIVLPLGYNGLQVRAVKP